MNYYRKYPGDYAGDTQHLTLMEHGAYNKLMDYCYGKDTISIPKTDDLRYRICGARTRHEKEAVRNVVREFFPDGVNNRIQRQLPEELERVETARANGALGGRPKQKPSGLAVGNPEFNPDLTQRGTQAQSSPTPTPTPSPTPTPPPSPNAEFKKQNSLLCTEHFANDAKSPVLNGSGIFLKTCKTGEEWEVPIAKIGEWEGSYPDVDVRLTLLGIRQWLSDNPRKRKTSNGMVRFLGAWMMREQDKPDPRSYAKTQH